MSTQSHKGVMVTRKTLVENGVYHVTQRAPGRELLFLEEGDYLRFLKLLKETAEKFSLEIFSFALMPNHLHLLLRTTKRNLDRAMKYLFQSYALGFNKKYQRKGHVFCGVYRASLCADDSYLLAASVYIHLNPFKAGLTSNPFEYRWFSLDAYTSSVKSGFLRPEVVLSILNDKDSKRARDAYCDLIRRSMQLAYDRSSKDASAVRNFREEFLHALSEGQAAIDSNATKSLKSMCDIEKDLETIRDRGLPRKPGSRKAVLYLVEQLKAAGYQGCDIADKLGISRMTYYRFMRSSHSAK